MEVKLSQKTFKALANPTRIAILKQLDKRNHTQSELSENLGFAVPTIKQHIHDLEKAGLVSIVDEGRKWKYIKLTKDGKAILHPEEKKIWILLSTLGASIVGGIIAATQKAVQPAFAPAPGAKMLAEEAVTTATQDAAFAAREAVATTAAPIVQTSILVYVFIAIAILSALGLVILLIKRKKRLKFLTTVRGKTQ